jgi:hypothetical protein
MRRGAGSERGGETKSTAREPIAQVIRLRLWFLGASIALIAACNGPAHPNGLTSVPLGTWGGEHISLVVQEGGATILFDCAHGSVEEHMALDASGRFDVRGSFVPERGGPGPGDSLGAHPSRYAGSTDGRTMRLTVTLSDTSQSMGSFTASLGESPRLVRCLSPSVGN